MESHDDVGHLHAGVVDVVLHLDLPAEARSIRTNVSPRIGVAQVSDVGGLVGIDIGVLDDDLAAGGPGLRRARASAPRRSSRGPAAR